MDKRVIGEIQKTGEKKMSLIVNSSMQYHEDLSAFAYRNINFDLVNNFANE